MEPHIQRLVNKARVFSELHENYSCRLSCRRLGQQKGTSAQFRAKGNLNSILQSMGKHQHLNQLLHSHSWLRQRLRVQSPEKEERQRDEPTALSGHLRRDVIMNLPRLVTTTCHLTLLYDMLREFKVADRLIQAQHNQEGKAGVKHTNNAFETQG